MSNPTWKTYGGIRKLDQYNTMSVYSFAADVFTLRQAVYGTFDICGELHVSGNARIDSNIYGNNLTVVKDLSTNRLFVNDVTIHKNNVDVSGTLYVYNGNTYLMQNLDVSGHIYLRNELYLGNSFNSYLYGTDVYGNVGVNTRTPIATLDISSQYPFAFNVGSKTQSQIYSVPLQNNANKGFVLSANTTTSRIGFYNDAVVVPVTNAPDALVQYTVGGFLTLDCSQNVNLFSNVSVSNRPTNTNAHVMGEPMVIYDTSSGTYLYSVYENAKEFTGNALSLIANDSSSNTFMNIIAPNRQGISLGGGVYPNDAARSMGSIGWRDISANYTPAINVVSGSSNLKQKTTVGINTHGPETENYAFDVNGPIHVKNGELTVVKQPTFEIKHISTGRSAPNSGVAIGSPYKYDPTNPTYKYRQQILYTTNGGETWNSSFDNSGDTIEGRNNWFRCSYVYDSSLSIIAGDGGYAYYTYNGYYQSTGNNSSWQFIQTRPWIFNVNASIKTAYINAGKRVFFGVDVTGAANSTLYWFDLPSNIYTATTGIVSSGVRDGSLNVAGTGIKSIDGCGNVLWIAYGSAIVNCTANAGVTAPTLGTPRTNAIGTYNSLSAFDSNNVVAAGTNVITYTNNGGSTWTDISIPGITVNSVRVCDTSNAIAVCNGGIVLASNNGYSSWFQVSAATLNGSGNSNRLMDAGYNLSCVAMVNTNNFFVSKITTPYVNNGPGQSSLFHAYLPNLFNNATNYVFDLSGSARFSGDLNINDGGKIASNNQTFNLLKNGVNQIYFGNDASNVYVGSNTLNSKVACNYDVNVAHDLSANGNIWCNNYLRTSFIDSSGGAFGRDAGAAPTGQYDITIGGQNIQGVTTRNIRIGNFHSPDVIDTSNTVYVSGPADRLIIQGEMIQSQSVKFGGQYIYLNYGGGSGSSVGSGIYFYDDGIQTNGKIAISSDRQGFIFRSTEPLKRNVVKLDVSNMIIADSGQSTGIVSISRSAAATDSSYSLAVSIIDPSNIMIINKNRSTLPWQQTVDTSLSVFGPMSLGKYSVSNVNCALDVSGNIIFSGGNNTIQTSNTIVNNNMSIGKLVAATTGYNLDVSGNVQIAGGNVTVTSSNTVINKNVSIGKLVSATAGYNLDVSGNILFSGGNNTIQTSNTIVNNNMSIGKTTAAATGYNLDVSGNVQIAGGNVTVTSSNAIVNNNMSIGTSSTATTGYILDVNGNVKIAGGNVTVTSSNTILKNNMSIGTSSTATTGYILDVNGNVKIAGGNVTVTSSNAIINNNMSIGKTTAAATGYNLDVSGNILFSGGNNTIQTSNTIVNNNMSIGKTTAAATGYNLDVSGNVQIAGGNVTVTSSNTIVNNNMSIGKSTSAATGYSLEISGNVYVSQSLTTNNVNVSGSMTNTSGLSISGVISGNTNTLIVTGNAAISTNLLVSGTASVTSSLTANGITVSTGGITASATQTITFGSNAPTMSGTNIANSTIPIASVVGTAMDLTTTQTASGAKTFSGGITVSSGITASTTQTINLGTNAPTMNGNNITSGTIPVASVMGTAMDLTTTQTASGAKTFSGGITVSSGITASAIQTINLGTNAPTMYGNNVATGTIPIASVVGTAMDLTTTQTASGAKTFSGGITVSSGITASATQTINLGTNAPTMYGNNITSGTIPIASVVGTAVNLNAAQTVSGLKTFTGGITATGAQTITFGTNAPTMYGTNIATNTIPIASVVGTAMDLTTTQTVGGTKTFSNQITAPSYNATSDRRLKTNVAPLSSQWTTINKIEPVTFNWIADGRPDIGFIAQNVYNTYPQLRPNYDAINPTSNIDEPVDLSGNPLYYAIDYGRMTPFLWQGMREVMRRIETLESENAELKTRIRTIESALA